MSISSFQLPDAIRKVIHRLADGLVPLGPWIEGKKDHVPDGSAPWRNGARLEAECLKLADFLEMIIRETSWNADLKVRWDDWSTDPLGRCPIAEPVAWRRNRGLDAEPAFAITSSDVVLGKDVKTREISRLEFYAPFWAPLRDAYAAKDADPGRSRSDEDDIAFAVELLDGVNPFWPEGAAPSSLFCVQFVKDVLYCYLGLRNLAPSPFADAVLIELGEQRRVGNRYGSADAEAAVEFFRRKLVDTRPEPGLAQAAARSPPDVQGIGSPPVNARDL